MNNLKGINFNTTLVILFYNELAKIVIKIHAFQTGQNKWMSLLDMYIKHILPFFVRKSIMMISVNSML